MWRIGQMPIIMNMVRTWNNIAVALLLMAALVLQGCAEKPAPSGEELRSPVEISAGSGNAVDVEVKSAVNVSKPENFGMMVVDYGSTYTAYQDFTSNVAVSRRNGIADHTEWNFRYSGSKTDFQNFFFINKKDSGNNDVYLDVYAYAPYNGNLTPADLTAIPYRFNTQGDLMWALQNASDFTFPSGEAHSDAAHYCNRNIRVDGNRKYVQFDFRHVLSQLSFRFRLKNTAHPYDGDSTGEGTVYYLVKVRITAKDGTLPVSGTLNAITGVFQADDVYSTEWVQEGSITHPLVTISGGEYVSGESLLLCPDASFASEHHYASGDYVLDLMLATNEKNYLPYATFTLNADHLGGNGFEAGKKYTLDFTFDNHLHFDGMHVGEWEPVQTIEYGI